MNKTILILIIAVVILIAAVGGYFIYKNSQNSIANTNTPASDLQNQQQNPPQQNPPPTQQQELNASVSIKNFAFDPTPLNVKAGTIVTWTNNDAAPHQIKSDTFNSATLNSGQTFSFTFSAAGQYSYSCAIHPSMHGQIIVAP